MPGYSFPLPVRVGRKIYILRFFDFLSEIGEHLAFSTYRYIFRLILMLHIYPQLALGEVADMAAGSFYIIIRTEEFLDGFNLRRRFHDDKILIQL